MREFIVNVMFKKIKLPHPNTTGECENLRKAVVSAIDIQLSSKQAEAYTLLEIIYKRRCKKVLTYLYRKYSKSPWPSIQQFAKKALEYRNKFSR